MSQPSTPTPTPTPTADAVALERAAEHIRQALAALATVRDERGEPADQLSGNYRLNEASAGLRRALIALTAEITGHDLRQAVALASLRQFLGTADDAR